jgi:hypothetical protein
MDPTTAEADAAYCLDQVRRFDRDRYLTALFAGAPARDDLMALYAFNLEVAKTREVVRESMMGLMRLQWWRDAIADIYAGNERRHQVVQPLAAAIRRRGLDRAPFDRLIDARESDMGETPPADLPAVMAKMKAERTRYQVISGPSNALLDSLERCGQSLLLARTHSGDFRMFAVKAVPIEQMEAGRLDQDQSGEAVAMRKRCLQRDRPAIRMSDQIDLAGRAIDQMIDQIAILNEGEGDAGLAGMEVGRHEPITVAQTLDQLAPLPAAAHAAVDEDDSRPSAFVIEMANGAVDGDGGHGSPGLARTRTIKALIGCRILGGLCCKSRFALVIKNSKGHRHGFRVKM